MKNAVQVFNNSLFGEIRVVVRDGEPWFIGKDVAEKLGYSNPSKAISVHIDAEDKLFLMLTIADAQNGNLPKGQTKTAIINESGLYSLILRSKLPEAKAFKHWVTSEVLPAIRKQGMYLTPEKAGEALNDPAVFLANAIKVADEVIRNQQQRLLEQQQVITEQHKTIIKAQPKVEHYNNYMSREDTVSITEAAAYYGYTQGEVFRILREIGWLFRVNGVGRHHISKDAPPIFKEVQTYWGRTERGIQVRVVVSGLPVLQKALEHHKSV